MAGGGGGVLVVLADGAEEMETVISVDVLRRAGLSVTLAGLTGDQAVTCSRDVKISPDTSLASMTSSGGGAGGQYDCVLLPGGGRGAAALCASPEVGLVLRQQDEAGRMIAAICAAPTALASHQVGLGRALTSYPAPAFREKLSGSYQYREEDVVVDGNIVTSRGPGTTVKFALEIVKILLGEEKMKEVAAAIDQRSEMSVFENVQDAPPIEVFQLGRDFQADTFPDKVSLGVGAYRTDLGKPWILPVVKKAETILAGQIEAEEVNHEYLPVLGLEAFTSAATKMLLGSDSPALAEGRAAGVQTLSGTGALRIGGDFLKRLLGYDTVYVSSPTWGNHNLLFRYSGYTNIRSYRYWDHQAKSLDFAGLCEDLEAAPANSVIVLHACAHNPTGMDPTKEQWGKIADICRQKKLFPFFDCAYQGFASGCLDTDAWAVRYFVSQGFELFCSQSFSKNFGLYNERAGNLTVVTRDPANLERIKSQLTLIIRAMYSNPPSHGARVVATVLNNPQLYQEWRDCIKIMAERIIQVRTALRQRLEELGTPGDWSHITTQIGMFSYPGLTEEMSIFLKQEKHLYLLKSGRISMCGVTSSNVDYVAKAVHEAVLKFQAPSNKL